MGVPFFFCEELSAGSTSLVLDEESSRHIVQVLRMTGGEPLRLTNGAGYAGNAIISDAHKKHCSVTIGTVDFSPRSEPSLTIGISPVKNTSRFEWFVEKAAELGAARIIPVICERTEKQRLRIDRLMSISKSAMLQSGQVWMTAIEEPVSFKIVMDNREEAQRLFGHIAPAARSLADVIDKGARSRIILIGPEGDFTPGEIAQAQADGFEGVSFGNTVLRVETAGVYAAAVHAAIR